MVQVPSTDVSRFQMYDHLRKGWFAIAFMAMGFMCVGFILVLFMLGERPLGLRFFKSKNQIPEERTSGAQTPKEKPPTEGDQLPPPRA